MAVKRKVIVVGGRRAGKTVNTYVHTDSPLLRARLEEIWRLFPCLNPHEPLYFRHGRLPSDIEINKFLGERAVRLYQHSWTVL